MSYKDKYKEYKQKYLLTKFIPERFQSAYRNFKLSLNYKQLSIKSQIIYNQEGGKIYKWFDDKDKKSHTFEMNKTKTEDSLDISVVTDDGLYCILVSVPWKTVYPTVIQNLSYYKECSKEGLQEIGGGDKLLRFMLEYLKANKDVYHIKKIILNDTSFKPCKDCPRTIKLAQLRQITHGHTWYMKYGFRPYDNELNKEHKFYINAIKHNNQTIDKMDSRNLNIKNILKKVTSIKLNDKEIQRLANKYPNIREFIMRLLKEYDKYCCFVNEMLHIFYELKIGKPSQLIDLFKVSYYLDL